MASLPNEILPQILQLIQSPLLQGGALTALLELFQALVITGLPKHGFRDFLQVDILNFTLPGDVIGLTVVRGTDEISELSCCVRDCFRAELPGKCLHSFTDTFHCTSILNFDEEFIDFFI